MGQETGEGGPQRFQMAAHPLTRSCRRQQIAVGVQGIGVETTTGALN